MQVSQTTRNGLRTSAVAMPAVPTGGLYDGTFHPACFQILLEQPRRIDSLAFVTNERNLSLPPPISRPYLSFSLMHTNYITYNCLGFGSCCTDVLYCIIVSQ